MKKYLVWLTCKGYVDEFGLYVSSPVVPELHHLERYVKWLGGNSFLRVKRPHHTDFQWISTNIIEKVRIDETRKT
jgi:hypothetical protein